jgi:hypothetical protein
MLVVRCKDCNKEITSHPTKTQCCGCSNMMTVKGDGVSAIDLSRVVMVNSTQKEQKNVLSSTDLAYQEARRQRKVRKLDFEIR